MDWVERNGEWTVQHKSFYGRVYRGLGGFYYQTRKRYGRWPKSHRGPTAADVARKNCERILRIRSKAIAPDKPDQDK